MSTFPFDTSVALSPDGFIFEIKEKFQIIFLEVSVSLTVRVTRFNFFPLILA